MCDQFVQEKYLQIAQYAQAHYKVLYFEYFCVWYNLSSSPDAATFVHVHC